MATKTAQRGGFTKTCPDCLGTGMNPEQAEICLRCDGRGKIPTTREEN
jgi:uncharacterized phage protein